MQALGMWLISILIMKVFAISCVIYCHVIMVGHFEKSGNWIFPRFLLTPRMTAGSSLICFTSRGCKRNREKRVLDISSVRQLTTRRGFRITVPLRGSGHHYRRKSKLSLSLGDGTITTFIFNIVQY